jgi:hypothetical protein
MSVTDHVIDIISSVVGLTAQEQLATLKAFNSDINAITFIYGSSNELVETLVQMDKSPSLKYNIWPAIMLFLDVSTDTSNKGGQYPEITLQLAIVMPTKTDYKAAERYEHIFEPILYPLWREFVKQLIYCGCFADFDRTLSYTKYDRPYWGKQGNTLHEVVDAIEIKDLKLKLIPGSKAPVVVPADQFFDPGFFNINFFK